jgi:hypothetical protein
VVAAPLAVVVGLKLPHDELPHVTLQVTPALAESPVTVAMTLAVAPVASDEGGGVVSETEIAGAVVMVMEAVADFVGSDREVAVTVTTPAPGTVAGAVKVVLAPLAVFEGLKLPHDEVLHETDQITPPLSESLLTVAEMVVVVPTCIVVTRCELSETEIGVGGFGSLPPAPEQPIDMRTIDVAAMR